MDPRQVLDLPMPPNGAGEATVRGYLVALLRQVWREGECFSGKRPFGDSGWQVEIYQALVKGSVLNGDWSDDGTDFVIDEGAADAIIDAAICAL